MPTTKGHPPAPARAAERELDIYRTRIRTLMADLLLAEEHERRRLAVDLHDGLTQTLALMGILLGNLRRTSPDEFAKPLAELSSLVEQANAAARSIGYELSPPVLHEVGLEPAVHWLIENIHSRYGIDVTLTDDDRAKPLATSTRIIVFRGIRELLINAAKHASAQKVAVELQRDGDTLVAHVDDDGVGMVVSQAAERGSGLAALRERIEHVGGALEIDSAPGHGTRAELRAPCTTQSPSTAEAQS